MGAEQDKELGPPDAVVRLAPGMDLSGAKLSAAEGFVLSRVDGESSLQTLCLITGLGEAQTLEILTGLKGKGLIVVGNGEPPPPRPGTRPGVSAVRVPDGSPPEKASPLQQVDTLVDPEPAGRTAQATRATGGAADTAPAAEDEWQDSDTAEECDLKPERRKLIRELHGRMGALNLFELFEVPPRAEIKEIRKAFFIKSKVYHPDRYFGRKLGPYGEMLHEIFKQMNAGYKMLCDKDKLVQYREMVVQQQEQERLAHEVARQAADYLAEEERLEHGSPVVEPRRAGGTFRAHRAKALMDLVGQRKGERPVPAPVEAAERRVRRQSDHRIRTKRVTGIVFSRAKKGHQFYVQGKQQLERGQFLAATASLKLAMTYNPEDKEYSAAFQMASQKAGELAAENYYKRGMMEESVGRFDAAADSFVKAAKQNPQGAYLMKAAEAMLWSHDSDDLIKAKDYVTRAVQTDPNSVDIRLVAARVFRTAGMKKNAHRELQMALKIEPGNAEAKELLKGV